MTRPGGAYRSADHSAGERLALAVERLALSHTAGIAMHDGHLRLRDGVQLSRGGSARVGTASHIIERLVLARDATQDGIGAKLTIELKDCAHLTVIVSDGRLAGARLKSFAIALAAWLDKSLEIHESRASMSLMRRADRDEGLDVSGVPRPEADPRALRPEIKDPLPVRIILALLRVLLG